MNRRSFIATTSLLPGMSPPSLQATPKSDSHIHEFSDIRAASMYYRSVVYDVAPDDDSDVLTLHSWACGFIAHPASRSTYRKFPNLYDDGSVLFSLPGLPPMRSEMEEHSSDIFGEDGVLARVSALDDDSASGAIALCLNGVLVQLVCLEPSRSVAAEEAVTAVRTITEAIQNRDPDFYGRGEMNRLILGDHVATLEDVNLVFHRMRVREDQYTFVQDDGISDFWEQL